MAPPATLTGRKERAPQHQLWLCVTRPYPGHHTAAGLLREKVGHGEPPSEAIALRPLQQHPTRIPRLRRPKRLRLASRRRGQLAAERRSRPGDRQRFFVLRTASPRESPAAWLSSAP